MIDADTPEAERLASAPSLVSRFFSMGLTWAAMGGTLGFEALKAGNLARASQITWFVLAGGASGVIAVLVSRAIRRGEDQGSVSLLLGGAITGALVLALLVACTWGQGWVPTTIFTTFALVVGAVLGFGGAVFSLVIEQMGLRTVVRLLLSQSSGR
jgi:hypothetical protein